MTREQANLELTKYKALKGKTSTNFYSMVEDIFIGHNDHIKVRIEYEARKDKGIGLSTDDGNGDFIVWAKFDKLFVPAKFVQV